MKKVSMASLVSSLFVLAICLVLPLSAYSADKLVVKDAGGTNTVFVVQDTGFTGIGTSTPLSTLHLSEQTTNFDRGLTIGQHHSSSAAAIINIKRSRGTASAPQAVVNADNIAAIHTQGYDGSVYQVPSSIMFSVDGAVSSGNVPAAISFITGTSTASRPERMRITSAGKVIVKDLVGTYTGGSAYVCVNNAGQIFASETACP